MNVQTVVNTRNNVYRSFLSFILKKIHEIEIYINIFTKQRDKKLYSPLYIKKKKKTKFIILEGFLKF